MLILSRRESECVCLGDDIVLTIVAVGNDKIRIGVQAPAGVRILRTELEKTTLPFPPQPAAQPATTEPVADKTQGGAPLRAMIAKTMKPDAGRRAA